MQSSFSKSTRTAMQKALHARYDLQLYDTVQACIQNFAKVEGFFGSLIQPQTNLIQIFISLELD